MVYKFKFKIDRVGMKVDDSLKKSIEKKLDSALNDLSDFIGTESDKNLRDEEDGSFDTGFLAGSLVVDKEKFLWKEVGYSSSYAPYIEYGSDPHRPPIKPIYDWLNRKKGDLGITIKSNKKVALKDGNSYNVELLKITMAIIHKMEQKGTEAAPFLRPAFILGKSKAKEFIKNAMKK